MVPVPGTGASGQQGDDEAGMFSCAVAARAASLQDTVISPGHPSSSQACTAACCCPAAELLMGPPRSATLEKGTSHRPLAWSCDEGWDRCSAAAWKQGS